MASRIRALLCSAFVLVAFASPGFAQSITEFPVPDGTIPFRITTGPDGALEALQAGETGVLLIPLDLSAYRMNIGVRTLDAATAFTLTVRNAGGGVVASIPRFFPAVHHEQQSASAFLNGLALPPGGSITVSIGAGSAIVYGATVDNTTGDPSLQVARGAP